MIFTSARSGMMRTLFLEFDVLFLTLDRSLLYCVIIVSIDPLLLDGLLLIYD
jgi:hypothetical protein